MSIELLAVQHVAAVEAATELPWLVEELWPEEGVGFLAGHPKSCKSWMADRRSSTSSRHRSKHGEPAISVASRFAAICEEVARISTWMCAMPNSTRRRTSSSRTTLPTKPVAPVKKTVRSAVDGVPI